MANEFWEKYNQQQRKIMEERERVNHGKSRPTIKPAKWDPTAPVKPAPASKKPPVKKAPAKKKDK